MENNKKNEMAKMIMEIEYYSPVQKDELCIDTSMKLPLSKISDLGVAFEPLAAAFQNVINGGKATSGLYRVTIPNGRKLAKFTNEPAYLGSVLKENGAVGGGQARLNPLVCNPTMLFMAAALISIDRKLDSIQETQQEIIEFLEQKEKSKLKGNLNVLSDVLNNYKYNCDNEKYKTNKHIQVQEIKRDAEQSIILYQDQIEKNVLKQPFLHSDQDVKNTLEKIKSEFKDYQLALYLYSYSSFLEVMLLENYESRYLDSVAQKIEDYSYQYRELYTKCYYQIEGYAKSSIQSHLLSGLSSINRVAGNAVAKFPVVSKSQIDENLIEAGTWLEKIGLKNAEKTMVQFISSKDNYVRPFIENINAVNRLYNQPMEILLDKESLYIRSTQ